MHKKIDIREILSEIAKNIYYRLRSSYSNTEDVSVKKEELLNSTRS
jgi:hypothetical protein